MPEMLRLRFCLSCEQIFICFAALLILVFLIHFICQILIQDPKNNVDADLVMLEELKVKCRTQTEQIMAWKKAYSMQVIEYIYSFSTFSTAHTARDKHFFLSTTDVSADEMKK